jgi:hypothetical protein
MEGYKQIKSSIVAIASARIKKGAHFPHIIGTGFFIHEDGVIVTNKHVIDQIRSLQTEPEQLVSDLIKVLYFEKTPTSMRVAVLGVFSVAEITRTLPEGSVHYGPDSPDIGLIVLRDVSHCPAVKFYEGEVEEGASLAVAGFPMGERALSAPGWLHQIGPTLQTGTVASLLPFACEKPHGYLIDVVIQGGSSGSPLFVPNTGEVVGIMYGGLVDYYESQSAGTFYQVPTSLSLAVPARYLMEVKKKIESDGLPKRNTVPLADWLKSMESQKVSQSPREAFKNGPVKLSSSKL